MSTSDMQQKQDPNPRQPIELESNLKKIAELNLDNKKVGLMKETIFGSLSSITNKKESSATLVAALCSLYDPSKGVFQLNDETCFSFCSQEIAKVIGMQDSGIEFQDYAQQCRSDRNLPSRFPNYLMDLRDQFADNAKSSPITAADINKILTNMSVDDNESKLHFKELMIYYLIEEVLLCGKNSKKPRSSMWRLVGNLEKCESVNWAKAIDEHLRDAIVRCQVWQQEGASKGHCFTGATPVLEAVMFERISKIRPKDTWETVFPLIQKYKSQRKDVGNVLRVLKAVDILPCPHCTASSGSMAVENTANSGSPLAVTPEDSMAGQLTHFSLSSGKEKVWYDDGDNELIDLKTQKWELVEDVSPMLDSDAAEAAMEDEHGPDASQHPPNDFDLWEKATGEKTKGKLVGLGTRGGPRLKVTSRTSSSSSSHAHQTGSQPSKQLVQAVPRDVSSNQSGVICAHGYKVKNVNAPILEAIIKKHGDIASTCVFPDASVRTSLLDAVCDIVGRIETNDAATIISHMKEIESQLLGAEAVNINVSWLRASLNAIHKRNEAGKSLTLLMEMKTNTILVKRAASHDLVDAEKQLAKAKRCVEVFDLVEKKVKENFLESKAKRDVLAGHPII